MAGTSPAMTGNWVKRPTAVIRGLARRELGLDGPTAVILGLGPRIHVFARAKEGVDGRVRPGHDGELRRGGLSLSRRI